MNIGVIGTGTVASWVSSILNQLNDPKIKLYACFDANEEKGKQFKEKFHYVNAYSNIDELLRDENVDVIYIAVPNHLHKEIALKALNANKNVVLEKPFAVNEKDCKEILNLAKKNNLFISEALWPLFLPSYKMIKEEINRGAIGELVSGEIMMLDFVMFLDRVKKLETGGGSLLDGGPYTLGCLTYFFGTDIKEVKSTTRRLDSGVDAEDELEVNYNNGVKVKIKQTIDCPHELHQEFFEIVGTKGKIRSDVVSNPHHVDIFDLEGKIIKSLEIPPQIKNEGMPPVSGYEYEWIAFEKAISKGDKECLEIPHSSTLKISSLMTDARKQAKIKFPFED